MPITCPIHGEFWQIADSHIKGMGCKACSDSLNGLKGRLNSKEFIIKAKFIHGDKYDYSKVKYVKSNKNVIITCPIHGDFLQTPNGHLNGSSCSKCGNISTSLKSRFSAEYVLRSMINTHGDKYDYSECVYVNSKAKMKIKCKKHGIFYQSYEKHVKNKHGCPDCGKKGGYSRSEYVTQANGRICTLYKIRCFNETENFYKIGITVNELKVRFAGCRLPYNYEVVSEINGEAGYIWDLEKTEHRRHRKFHYTPLIFFKGCVKECFTKLL